MTKLWKVSPKFFNFVVCNLCQSSPSLTILVPLWLIIISLVFFYLCKVLFSGFLQFNGDFVDGQINSMYRDCARLTKLTAKSTWYSQSAVFIWHCMLSGSVFQRGPVPGTVVLVYSSTSFSLPLPSPPIPFMSPLLTLFHGWETAWGLMAELQGFPAIGVLYCQGAGWSQWRPLDIPGFHLPFSTMQLLTEFTYK